MTSHIVPFDGNNHSKTQIALCGARVPIREQVLHGATPTCTACREKDAEDAAALEALGEADLAQRQSDYGV